MNGKTPATLFERLRQASDPVTWEEFCRRYGTLVYSFARRRGCSEHTAEDILQDVMLNVFEHRDVFAYDRARGRFRDWLGVLVRNTVVSYRRQPSQRVRGQGGADLRLSEPEAADARPETLWETAFEETLLLALLDVLRSEMNPQAYLAFELRALRGLPGAKVATYTGLSRHAVYRAHRKGLKRLRELGATYRDDGQLLGRIKEALRLRPDPTRERSLTMRIRETMHSRSESSGT